MRFYFFNNVVVAWGTKIINAADAAVVISINLFHYWYLQIAKTSNSDIDYITDLLSV